MGFHGGGKSTTDQGRVELGGAFGMMGHGGDEGGGVDNSEGRGGVQGSEAGG